MLLRCVPDALALVDRRGRIVQTNTRLDDLFGYAPGELAGKQIAVLIPERFRQDHQRQIADFFSTPRIRHMGEGPSIDALRKDGTEFPVDISLSTIEADDDLLVAAAIRDITELKRREQEVEQNYQMQQVMCSILKSSLEPRPLQGQMEHILDRILSVPWLALESRGAIYLVEDDPGLLVLKAQRGFSQSQLAHCEKIPFGECLCGEAAAAGEVVYAASVDNRHKIRYDDMFSHGHYCVPVLYHHQTLGLINVFVKQGHQRKKPEEDFLTAVANTTAGIIERHRSELDKQQLQEQLSVTEKLTALGRMTQNIAHEIRNPLAAVGGFARRLDKILPPGKKEKEYARLILSDVRRLENTLKNVLTFSSEEGPRLEEHPLREIIEPVAHAYEDRCRDQAIQVQESYEDLPPIFVDKDQVREAVENLVSNAMHAMPAGGTLTIRTDQVSVKQKPFLRLRVTDTGSGIGTERLGRIFEPFFTAKEAAQVTTLGLPITKKIMDAHGGIIQVESEVGKGSTFSLFFPLGGRP